MLVSKPRYFHALAGIFLAWATVLLSSAQAEQKGGMPDLGQEEQTCLPTSTANLIVWFGLHGYPKLIVPGDSDDDGYIHTIHGIMAETNARYDLGTRTDAITGGIAKYIRDAGYNCDVEYRGLDWSMVKFPEIVKDYDADKYKDFNTKPATFTQDWLSQNSDPQKGFILLLAYCRFDRSTNTFTNAINAGHAVTLVDAQPDTLLIHDPAHWEDEPGRKIITPELLTGGSFELPGYNAPVSGLLLLSGSLLEAPPDSVVMLTGAVCITMHPHDQGGVYVGAAVGAPASAIGATQTGTTTPSSPPPANPPPAAPSSSNESWAMWVFDWLFKK
jgi:hypothetical protein